jgi:hypothetical protein
LIFYQKSNQAGSISLSPTRRGFTLVHQPPKLRSNNNQADLKDKSSDGQSLSAALPALSIDLGCYHHDCDARLSS